MSAMWIIYLAEVSAKLSVGLGTAAVMVLVILFFLGPPLVDFEWGKFAKLAKKLIPIACALGMISALIPSKQTVYLMAAAKVSQDIVESPDAKLIGDKMLTVINQELDALIERRKKRN